MAQATFEGPEIDNAAQDYESYRESTNSLEVQKFLDAEFGITREEVERQDPLQFVKKDEAPATTEPIDAKMTFTKSIAENIVEIPLQSLGGPIDAFNEVLQFTDDVGTALTKIGLPSSYLQITNPKGEFDVRFLKPAEKELAEAAGLLEIPEIPAPGKPDTLTGSMTREVTKFLASFLPAVRGVKAIRGTEAMGITAMETTTASAISAAVARDPHEARLATFLNDVPWLSEVVPDYLADNNQDNESAWEGRLKNAVDEAGFGLVADGLISAFKYYKAQRKAQKLAKEEQDFFDKERVRQEELQASVEDAPKVTQEQLIALGNPASNKTFERIKKTGKRTEEATGVPPSQGNIFINMAKINTPDDVRKLIQDVANSDAKAINRKRGGAKKTLAKMVEESDQEYLDLKDLIGREPGPMTASQALAARQVLASSADQLVALAKRANSGEAQQADLYAFRRGMAVHYAIQSEVVAARTETARSLRSWAIPVGNDEQRGQAIAELINSTNGAGSTKKMAKALANVGQNEKGINLMAEKFSRPKISDVVYQVWINGILSGPATQVVNILGNGIKAAYVIPKSMVDASISKAFYDGEISYLEATSAAFGAVKGFRNGMRLLWHGNKATDIGDLKAQFEQFSKIEGTNENIISAEAFGLDADGAFGRGIDYMARAINLPTSMLKGADTVFKSIGYQMEVQMLAMRDGISKGLDGDDLAKRIQEIADNPPDSINADAMDVAHYQTFTNPLGEKGRKLSSGLRAFPGVRYIAPFMRTPTNILVDTFKGTPLALASRSVRADIAAGGTRAAQAWGRIGTGTIFMLSAADMAMEGTITGKGPADPRLRKNLMRTGWKPYSVKMGDTYIPFNRLEPVGNFLAFGADIAEVINNLDDPDAEFLVSTMVMGFAENLKSKSYLQGIIGAITAFDPSNPMKTPEEWAARFAPSLIPFSSFFRQLAKAADPTLKITQTAPSDANLIEGMDEKTAVYLEEVLNEMRARVPGYSEDLPLRRDLWGKEISLASGYGVAFDLLSPIYASIEKPDALEKILINNEIPISSVGRTIQGVQLTGQEYSEYAKISGEMLREQMEEMVKDPDFQGETEGPEGMKSYLIQSLVRRVRTLSRAMMIENSASLRNRINQRQELTEQNLLGKSVERDFTTSAPVLPIVETQENNTNILNQLGGK